MENHHMHPNYGHPSPQGHIPPQHQQQHPPPPSWSSIPSQPMPPQPMQAGGPMSNMPMSYTSAMMNAQASRSSPMEYDVETPSSKNRGNYRCSKCGEPKKGHVCAYQPMNYKCVRCGNPKKACTCGTPETTTCAIQCELDEDMTIRLLDLSAQGVSDFHSSVVNIVGASS